MYICLGKTPLAGRNPKIFSQTGEPTSLLRNTDYLEVLLPDSLHWLLCYCRVCNQFNQLKLAFINVSPHSLNGPNILNSLDIL